MSLLFFVICQYFIHSGKVTYQQRNINMHFDEIRSKETSDCSANFPDVLGFKHIDNTILVASMMTSQTTPSYIYLDIRMGGWIDGWIYR